MRRTRLVWLGGAAALIAVLAAGCGGAEKTPLQGKSRTAVCDQTRQPPAFTCPSGTVRHGKPPAEGGTELWCQGKDGRREGPYRRFPPSSTAAEPSFAADGVVVGGYHEDRQDGPWWTIKSGAPEVNVAVYQGGSVAQRIHCPP